MTLVSDDLSHADIRTRLMTEELLSDLMRVGSEQSTSKNVLKIDTGEDERHLSTEIRNYVKKAIAIRITSNSLRPHNFIKIIPRFCPI